MQKSINSFFEDLSNHPRWTNFKAEVRKKLNSEITKLKDSISQNTWSAAERNYTQILNTLTQAQRQVDLEVQKALKMIKSSAADLEKTIKQYRALAIKQKQKHKRKKVTKKASKAKKVTKARSTKKTAKKA